MKVMANVMMVAVRGLYWTISVTLSAITAVLFLILGPISSLGAKDQDEVNEQSQACLDELAELAMVLTTPISNLERKVTEFVGRMYC